MAIRGDGEPQGGRVARKRGKLKVFLGMAAGVGKTYRMLDEAHRRVAHGEDVVVGYVEPHARPETQAMIADLEVVPPKRIEYRGVEFLEMDTPAVLQRHPQWALVDELAHTNIPGTEHPKRWQSIKDLLEAGINVISTVNIQHLESLNDRVFEITGVRVRETFPDSFLDETDDIEVVDVTPNALINRLNRGAVYDLAKVDQALVNFFTPDKLSALRELTLRRTADEVDDRLQRSTYTEGRPPGWGGKEVVVVAVTGREESIRLVRRGYRLADRMKAELHAVHVARAGTSLSTEERAALDDLWRLARNLGARTYEIKGEEVAAELVDFAVAHNATFVVLGQSDRSRLQEILRGSIVTSLMRETEGMDVVIVSEYRGKGPARRD